MKAGHVQYGRRRVDFQVRRSARKTLGITVQPDLTVLVSAPRRTSEAAIAARVQRRARWILKQQRFFEEYLPPLPPRRYESGETHRYLGRQYRLKVRESADESVKLSGGFLSVETVNKRDTKRVRLLVERWYSTRARAVFERSLEACLPRLRGVLQVAPRLRLRRMPKRWGSCTPGGVIYLNPELVRAPRVCIEYVVVHELCHLVHPNHGRAFFDLLRRVMPDWEMRKARLERAGAE